MLFFYKKIILLSGDTMKKNNIGTIFFIKLLICIVITLIILILIKSSSNFKNAFYKQVFSNNISFTKLVKEETVFNEKLTYESIEEYLDGVKLNIGSNYLVPINESGIVVFIGPKENYGNTVIIQRIDGIDEWYGNIENVNIKLYDYVSKGELLGEATNNLYLVYKKDGKVLNYEKYLK